MADQNIEILKKETYLKMIENSIGSKMFNSLFVQYKDSGEVKDVMNDGEYSCAFFVSSILYLVQIVERTTATVNSLKKLLDANSKWQKVNLDQIQPGDVVFWDKVMYEDGSENAHVGFILSATEAVSTNYKQKMIVRHLLQEDRPITDIYRFIWN